MGNEVFIRSQKGLTITPEGEKVANYAKEMLQREEDIKSELAVFRTETHGTLKLLSHQLLVNIGFLLF